MIVLIAGAPGTLGTPLTRSLRAVGHKVIGVSRTPSHQDTLRSLGARPVIADVLHRDGLLAAVRALKADAIVQQATALKKAPLRHRDMAGTNVLREVGTANLLEAARAVGARKFVTQSMIFGYGYADHGAKVLTEEDPFAPPGQGAVEQHLAALRSTERQTFTADGIEGIALRYGVLYGPGAGTEQMVALLRQHRLPVPRGRGGLLSFIYIEDAASATVAALERDRPGQAYNVVDDQPVSFAEFLETMAEVSGGLSPRRVPSWMFRPLPYAHAFLTGTWRVSNAKAKEELGWIPTASTYREGVPRAIQAVRHGA